MSRFNMDQHSAFFDRELDFIKAQTYDVLYRDLKATNLIPVNTATPAGAESITYRQFEYIGKAEYVADYGTDAPRCDVLAREFPVKPKSIRAAFGYSVQEIRNADMSGTPLAEWKLRSAAHQMATKINSIAWLGDNAVGLNGLLTHPNANRVAAPNVGGDVAWADKDGDEILDDLNTIANTAFAATDGVEMPDTLLLPLAQFTRVSSLRIQDINMTVLDFFLKNNPFITTVDYLNECAGAGIGVGAIAAGGDVAVAYRRDPSKLVLELPVAFEVFPPEARNLEWVVNCHARCAGVNAFYPLAITVMEGI